MDCLVSLRLTELLNFSGQGTRYSSMGRRASSKRLNEPQAATESSIHRTSISAASIAIAGSAFRGETPSSAILSYEYSKSCIQRATDEFKFIIVLKLDSEHILLLTGFLRGCDVQ